MRTIYAVFAGPEADDYLVCLTLTEELAEAAAEEFRKRSGNYAAHVDPFSLAECDGDLQLRRMYRVITDGDGKEIKRWTTHEFLWVEEYSRALPIGTDPTFGRALGGSYKSYEAALKSAQDALNTKKAAGGVQDGIV